MELANFDSLPIELQNSTTSYTFAAGQRLFRQGDRASNFYVVTSGRVKLVRYTIEGRMVVLQIVRSGESLGEDSFISDTYSYTAISEVESGAIAYPQPLLIEAVREYSELAENLIEHLSKNIHSHQVNLELLQIRSAHLRLLRYLQYNATLSNIVNLDQPLKEVAAELNLAPRSLSRALARLEYEGRITRQGDRINLQTL